MKLKRVFIYFLAELVLAQPVALALPLIAQAATTIEGLAGCVYPVSPSTPADTFKIGDEVSETMDKDPGEAPATNVLTVSDQIAAQDPFYDAADHTAVMQSLAKTNNGTYDAETKTWKFCTSRNADYAGFGIGGDGKFAQFLSTLSDPFAKIEFANPLDRYALTGEPCRLWIESKNRCDETLETVTKPDGSTVSTPKYFDDIFTSGASQNHWDAPKADRRILKTLVYLVTPVDQGGAGREHIKVGKIIQMTSTNDEVQDENGDLPSAHAYDLTNPGNPSKIATAMDITEIDHLRITTKVTQKSRLGDLVGGNAVTYSYSSTPIKVKWQTDQGAAAETTPSDYYSGALGAFSTSLGALLDQMGLGATIDLNSVNLSDIGSVAEVVGSSLIGAVLNSPAGSIKGWDLGSVLNQLGRAYIARELGLNANALSEGNSVSDVVQNIGRTTVETSFNLPPGSLKGDSSGEILTSIGTRYMESVLQIKSGTLTARQYSQNELLEKIGQGRIEERFNLPLGSFDGTDWSKITNTPKTKLVFAKNGTGYVDDALSLGYQEDGSKGVNPYGFSEANFENPTLKVVESPTPSNVSAYKRLVGSRAIETSIGRFTAGSGTNTTSVDTSKANFLEGLYPALGLTAQRTFTPTSASGNLVIISRYAQGGQTWNVTGSAYTQMLIDTGIMTKDEITALAKRAIDGQVSNSYAFPQNTRDAGAVLPYLNKMITDWRTPIGLIAGKLALQIELVNANILEGKINDLLALQSGISTELGLITTYTDALQSVIDAKNQSGRSAALNMPGILYAGNPDGTFSSSSLMTDDPINTALSGNMTPESMAIIGKIVLATKSVSDLSGQRTIAAQIKEDLSPTFGAFPSVASDWLAKGFESDDFERIFTKNLGPSVFERIGTSELLRVAWNKSDIAGYVNDAAANGGSGAITSVVNAANQVAAGYTFYSSRFTRLKEISASVSAKVATTGGAIGDIGSQLSQLNGQSLSESIKTIKANSSKYGALLKQAEKGATDPALAAQIAEANHILEEIAAGHELTFTQAPNTGTNGSSGRSSSGCLVVNDLRSLIQTNGSFDTFVRKSAGCQVDAKLGLPRGSVYAWYEDNDHTYLSLTLAVGRSWAKEQGNKTLGDPEAREKGDEILKGTALYTLIGSIPGLGGNLSQYGITAPDIAELLNGNGEALIRKIGGGMMDTYFNWSSGTAAEIIAPQCANDDGTKRACSQKESGDKRMFAMANIALKQLSLNLDLPISFDITADGDFSFNVGISQFSEVLGLKKNSFKGSFSDIRKSNAENLGNLLTGIGWYPSAFVTDLMKERSALVSAAASVPNTDAYNDIQAEIEKVDSSLKAIYGQILDFISDPKSGAYDETGAEAILKLADIYRGQSGEYANATASLGHLIELGSLSSSAEASLQSLYGSMAQTVNSRMNDSDWKQEQLIAFDTQRRSYLTRIKALDTQFGLTQGSMQQLITGTLNATSLAQAAGERYVRKTLTESALNKLLADTPYAKLYDTFKVLTKSATCPDGLGLADFIVPSSSVSAGCTAKSIKGISLSSILSGTGDAAKEQRAYLYDSFLSQAWGMKMETDLKVQPGTLRAIAMEPWRAKEIAIDQGIRSIAGQIFGMANDLSMENQDDRDTVNAFLNSMMAGFCPVNATGGGSDEKRRAFVEKGLCEARFDKDRALGEFGSKLNQMIGQRFASASSGNGTQIGLLDVSTILTGGMQGLIFIGAADLAANLNASIGTSDQRANKFKIKYADIKNAYGNYTLTPAELNAGVAPEQASRIRQYYYAQEYLEVDGDESLRPMYLEGESDSSMLARFQADTSIPEVEKEAFLAEAAADGREGYAKTLKTSSQERLRYQVYDIAAFKADPNIPAGFSYAMLKGTGSQRARYLALYAANSLNVAGSLFEGSGLTNEQVLNLGQYASTCFTGGTCDQSLVSDSSLSLLDGWFTKKSTELFGVELPSGTMQGIFAWGSQGFTGRTFDTSKKFKVGATEYPSLGNVLTDWGMEKLFTWADTKLGFDPGSAYQIYQAAGAVIAAQHALSLAQSAAPSLSALGGFFGNPDLGSQVAAHAKDQVTSAEAAVVSTAANIIFKDQIADAEQSLGLVPGTGATLVTMLVQLAMGVPVSPVTIAVFVIGNLFGTYSTEVTVRATASGYYPMTGYYGKTGFPTKYKSGGSIAAINPLNTLSSLLGGGGSGMKSGKATIPQRVVAHDPDLGSFNAKNSSTYRDGIRDAARSKVYYLLRDLLNMPAAWQEATGENGVNVWIPQIFTARMEDVEAVNDLASQPAPWEGTGGFGYGALDKRADVSFNTTTNQWESVAKNGFRAGVFGCQAGTSAEASAACSFSDHIHVRW